MLEFAQRPSRSCAMFLILYEPTLLGASFISVRTLDAMKHSGDVSVKPQSTL